MLDKGWFICKNKLWCLELLNSYLSQLKWSQDFQCNGSNLLCDRIEARYVCNNPARRPGPYYRLVWWMGLCYAKCKIKSFTKDEYNNICMFVRQSARRIELGPSIPWIWICRYIYGHHLCSQGRMLSIRLTSSLWYCTLFSFPHHMRSDKYLSRNMCNRSITAYVLFKIYSFSGGLESLRRLWCLRQATSVVLLYYQPKVLWVDWHHEIYTYKDQVCCWTWWTDDRLSDEGGERGRWCRITWQQSPGKTSP